METRVLSRAWALGLALFVLYSLTGCAGNGPVPQSGPTPTPTPLPPSIFNNIQQTIFNVSCVSAPCHSSTAQQGNLVLEEGVSYGNLVGVAPSNEVALAMGLERVVPGNADMSFLLIKLTHPGPGEGSLMPLGMPPLSNADIEKVRAWILGGAPGPGGATRSFSATPPSSGAPKPAPNATDTMPSLMVTATPTVPATFTPTPAPSGRREEL